MNRIIEKDSLAPALMLIGVFILLLAGAGGEFAYIDGAFGEKTTKIENNKVVENKTMENKTGVIPAEAPPLPLATALDQGKPARTQPASSTQPTNP